MKAAVLTDRGVEVRDAPKPKPAPNQVLVRVRAAGLNRADLIMASGRMHGSAGGPGTVLGLEFAGEVEAVGSDVKGIKPGDRVMCSGNGGLCRVCRHRLGPRFGDPRQQHELRAGGDAAGGFADDAQRGRHRRPAEGRRDRADPGRQLRRRPDRHADRQAQGRAVGDGHLDQCRAARAPQGVRRRSRRRHDAKRIGRTRCSRRPAARASTSSSTRCPPASPTKT